ncbi:uncharacterized protein F5891DRAFT_689685 [Suillus fuscotomentosus]|uniref:Zn(2)-C6 fungal-type domain-containing protein n=1 Tax=Suillus fuscotomentosus TaxID=1912939 RepID=A0AAD4HR15_9AGAM|nr:uncharacterized protein F5891DRAFT_689685 [Suillus fuscotomentosus]KAG1905426.1 hypothetical protein F5891DRAFT_689685 [Suillus fuscotomentosus]
MLVRTTSSQTVPFANASIPISNRRTCRLRRKKCDEQREANSCHTCKRLRIDCLGWGSRRPEWMRDKKAVEDYKAGIKAQLTRAGLIRGQPKSSILQASSAGPSSTPASSSSVFPSRQFQPSATSSASSRVNDLGMPAYVDSLSDPTGMSVFGAFFVIREINLIATDTPSSGSTLNSPQIISVPSVHERWELSAFKPQFPLQPFRLSSLRHIARVRIAL